VLVFHRLMGLSVEWIIYCSPSLSSLDSDSTLVRDNSKESIPWDAGVPKRITNQPNVTDSTRLVQNSAANTASDRIIAKADIFPRGLTEA